MHAVELRAALETFETWRSASRNSDQTDATQYRAVGVRERLNKR